MPLAELKRLGRVEKNADRARRLRIIILGIEGWTAPAVAIAVGLTRRICQRWVQRYNEQGLTGLDDQRGREHQSPLTPEQEAEVRRRLGAGPTEQHAVCSLLGKDNVNQRTLFVGGSTGNDVIEVRCGKSTSYIKVSVNGIS